MLKNTSGSQSVVLVRNKYVVGPFMVIVEEIRGSERKKKEREGLR